MNLSRIFPAWISLGVVMACNVSADVCELFPLAGSVTAVQELSIGTVLTNILHGTRPGSFGWLTWAGSPSEPTLVQSLIAPGNSRTYVNPVDSRDHEVSVGDWVQGRPGLSNSKEVRSALDALKAMDITIPVWDATNGQGHQTRFRVSGFARMRLLDYQLPGENRITVRFLGMVSCGTRNQPPVVSTMGDQTVTLPETVWLRAAVSDDGLPAGSPLWTRWMQSGGPAGAIARIVSPAETNTLVEFQEAGTYAFSLVASDSEFTSSNSVVVTVNRPNLAPVAIAQQLTNSEDAAVEIVLQGADPEAGNLAFAITVPPARGQLTGQPPLVRYTPLPDYHGPDRFMFTVSDGLLTSAATEVTITNVAVNDAPTAVPVETQVLEDGSVTIDFSGADVDGDSIRFVVVTEPEHGTLTVTTSNATYVPALNFFGVDRFSYVAKDPFTSSAPALVSLVVQSVNDVPVVDAGPNLLIPLTTNWVVLTGAVSDVEFSNDDLFLEWTVTGPGHGIVLSNVATLCPAVMFPTSGVFTLRLTAADFVTTNYDEVQVTVNAAPQVAAAADSLLTLPATLALVGSVWDDRFPTNYLSAQWSAEGAGNVVFGDATQTNTTAAFSESGWHDISLMADDGMLRATNYLRVLVNRAPVVDAGSPQVVTNLFAELAASVHDDGYPSNRLELRWEQVSGPGTATVSSNSAKATVSFSTNGTYELQLVVDDWASRASNTVSIVVNGAPRVDAGLDQTNSIDVLFTLEGSVWDDGLPLGQPLWSDWEVVSGPGPVHFVETNGTLARVRFHSVGTYVLRLQASDSVSVGHDEVTVTVLPANQAPLVSSGPGQLVLLPEIAVLRGVVDDDGLPLGQPLSWNWRVVSGPAVAFSDPRATNTLATFSATGNYVLRLEASDTAYTSFSDVRIAVRTPAMNEGPVVHAGPDRVVGLTNTLLLAGAVRDDGLPRGAVLNVEWQLAEGPGDVIFEDRATTNAIARFSAAGIYRLRLTASDSLLSHSDEVTVAVHPHNQPPVVDAGSDQVVVVPDPRLLRDDVFQPTNLSLALSRSLVAADRWENGIGQPGLNGLAAGTTLVWVDRNGLAFSDGKLWVAGAFTNAGGVRARGAALWDGQWSGLFDPRPEPRVDATRGTNVGWGIYDCRGAEFCLEAFTAVGAKEGEAFFGGSYLKDLGPATDALVDITARWSGTGWEPWSFKRASGHTRVIKTTPKHVYVAGHFAFQPTNASSLSFSDLPWSQNVAVWDGTHWGALGGGVVDVRDPVQPSTALMFSHVASLAIGATGEVYAGGSFFMNTPEGGATNVAMWNGRHWRPLGGGLKGTFEGGLPVTALALNGDGELFAGGTFTNAGGIAVNHIARWDGVKWSPLGEGSANGVNGPVEAIAVHGRDVYVGGRFTQAGGLVANNLARWNGAFWSSLGTGTSNGTVGIVTSLAVEETGLFVGGEFTIAGGQVANRIARWSFGRPPEHTVTLRGSVTDDGRPAEANSSVLWSVRSGPGEVTFARATNAQTTATFRQPGLHLLRLTAFDGELSGHDEVAVTVRDNQPPSVDAGPDLVLGVDELVTIRGFVSDDGLPAGEVNQVWSLVRAPSGGSLTFTPGGASASSLETTISCTATGVYGVRLTANDSHFSAFDEKTVVVQRRNAAPAVHPGSIADVQFPARLPLNGSISDDGLPAGITNVLWTQVSGPGRAVFSDARIRNPLVSFSTNGFYTLRLSADDTELSAFVDATVNVRLPPNHPPTVSAGTNQSITNLATRLHGTAFDDGLPVAGALRVAWTKVSGPGHVAFADSNSMVTAASFTQSGDYTLRLTANDGEFSTSAFVTIQVVNLPPLVNAGPDRALTWPGNSLLLTGLVLDTSPVTPAWITASASGNGTATFNPGGSVSVALTNTVSFSTTGTYVLRLVATDNGNHADELTVVVAPPGNQAPRVDAGPDQSVTDLLSPILLQGVVSDDGVPAGGNLVSAWSKFSGPGDVVFSQPTVTNGPAVTTAAFSTKGIYVLRLMASDGALTNGDDLVVTVRDPANAAPAVSIAASAGSNDGSLLRTNELVELHAVVVDDGLPAGGSIRTQWSEFSGPGAVTFSPAAATNDFSPSATAWFSLPGNYVLRFTADDGEATAASFIVLQVGDGDPNMAPVVNAGADRTVFAYKPAPLGGWVHDDGLPFGALDVSWLVISNPPLGRVYFVEADQVEASAHFYATGTYVLRLVGTDSRLTAFDDVRLNVLLPTNEAPIVFAGLPLEVTRPAPVQLSGLVLDDGIPLGQPLTVNWSKVSGPGDVGFQPSAGDPWAEARFSAPGEYILRLSASDTLLATFDDVTVVVREGTNQAPFISSPSTLFAARGQLLPLPGSVTDDGLPRGSLDVRWQGVSGPGSVTFSSLDGVYQALFDTAGEHVIRIVADDSALSATNEIVVTVRDVDGAPLVAILAPLDAAEVNAPTTIFGRVQSAALARWSLSYRSKGQQAATDDSTWTSLAAGTNEMKGAALAVFDPTLLLNGIYELQLAAIDFLGRASRSEPVTVIVAGGMKVGGFTLSFNDLTIPVAGIPLQVIRTYDARDRVAGDFGVGWRLQVGNVRLQKTRHLGTTWDQAVVGGFVSSYAIATTRPRTVSVIFPDGTVDRFGGELSPAVQLGVPLIYPRMRYAPIGRTRGHLVPVFFHWRTGERVVDDQLVWSGEVPGRADFLSWEHLLDPPPGAAENLLYNPDLFEFTTTEGYRYLISETNGLRQMTDPNGNSLVVHAGGITWSNTANASTMALTFRRDATGRITNIVDALGQALTYRYDAAGNLAFFTDREGNTNAFTYNDRHELLTLIDGTGHRVISNRFDAMGRLVEQQDAGGRRIGYGHDLQNRILYETNRLGHVASRAFDERGNVVRTVDPLGAVSTFTYDAHDNLLAASNAACACVTSFAYDSEHNLIEERDAAGFAKRYTHNARGQVLTFTDPEGVSTTNQYDALGNLVAVIDAQGLATRLAYTTQGKVAAVTNPTGGTLRFSYNQYGHLTNEVDELGNRTAYTVDPHGNLLSQTRRRRVRIFDPAKSATRTVAPQKSHLDREPLISDQEFYYTNTVVRFTHDANGRLRTTLLPESIHGIIQFEQQYNGNGQPIVTSGPAGQTITTYDAQGHVSSVTHPDGAVEGFEYDAEGHLAAHLTARGRTSFEWNARGQVERVTFPDSSSVAAEYDDAGRIVRETDQNGCGSTYEYDAVGNRVGVTDALGRRTRYAFNARRSCTNVIDALGRTTALEFDYLNRHTRITFPDGSSHRATYSGRRVQSITDEAGRTAQCEYDELGRLISLVDMAGRETRFQHDELGNLIAALDPGGRLTIHDYDQQSYRIRTEFPGGEIETFTRDAAGRVTSVTDAAGAVTGISYDAAGRVTSVTRPGNLATSMSYNSRGDLASVVNGNGERVEFLSDVMGRRLRATYPDGSYEENGFDAAGMLTLHRDRAGGNTRYTYDCLSRVVSMRDPAGQETTFEYDRADRRVGMTFAGRRTQFAYDLRNRLTQITRFDGAIERFQYDVLGRVASMQEAGGRTFAYSYDSADRVTGITGPLGFNRTFTYDSAGFLASMSDSVAGSIQWTRDSQGNATRTAYPDGAFTRASYDALGRQVGFINARGYSTALEYDESGRLQKVVDALGNETRYEYDGADRLRAIVDALQRRTEFSYDAVLRQQVTRFADGAMRTERFDPHGLRQSVTDEEGRTTSYTHDALRRLTGVRDALGGETRYQYDALGRLISHTDALGRTRTTEYDDVARKVTRTFAGGMTERFSLDEAGNVVERTDFNGARTVYEYDAHHRLIAVTPDAQSVGSSAISFTYDSLGRRTAMADGSGSTTYEYDARSRLLSKATPAGTLRYTYDPNGNVTSVMSSNPNGAGVTYEYDPLDRLVSVHDARLGDGTYAYDGVGNVAAFAAPNGVSSSYEYDDRDRLTRVQQGALAEYGYRFDRVGNRIGADETLLVATQRIERLYAYDALDRLLTESLSIAGSPALLDYSYDAVGNRLLRASTIPAVASGSDTFDERDRPARDGFDASGNTIAATNALIALADEYDFANHLVRRTATGNSQSSTVELGYNGDGDRVRRTVDGVATWFLIDELNPTGWPQVVEELTSVNGSPPAVTRVYSWGRGLLAEDRLVDGAWQARIPGADGMGSVRYLTGLNGSITDVFDYDAFGNLIQRAGETEFARLYRGEEFDADLGMYYLRARYYHPERGRFWTRDSFDGFLDAPSSQHRYVYAENNPVNRVDPGGHASVHELALVTGLAPDVRSAMDALWSGVNSFTHGLGGGEILKAKNHASGLFIQGLVPETGVHLGRRNFLNTLQGAPFLLSHNPYTYIPEYDCFSCDKIGFGAYSEFFGSVSRHPVFQFDVQGSPLYGTWQNIAAFTEAVGISAAVAPLFVAAAPIAGGVVAGLGGTASAVALASGTTQVGLVGWGSFNLGQMIWEQGTQTEYHSGALLTESDLSLRRSSLYGSMLGGGLTAGLGRPLGRGTSAALETGLTAARRGAVETGLRGLEAARTLSRRVHSHGTESIPGNRNCLTVNGNAGLGTAGVEALSGERGSIRALTLPHPDQISQIRMAAPVASDGGQLELGFVSQLQQRPRVVWPPRRGFSESGAATLLPGVRIDRFGRETGTFVALEGTPFHRRSLPRGAQHETYGVYEVSKPIDVDAGPAAPWFGEVGGGIQYELPQSVAELINSGHLRRIRSVPKYNE